MTAAAAIRLARRWSEAICNRVAIRLALSPLNVPAPVDERSTLPFVAIAFIAGFGLTRILEWRDRTVDELLGEEYVRGVRILTR